MRGLTPPELHRIIVSTRSAGASVSASISASADAQPDGVIASMCSVLARQAASLPQTASVFAAANLDALRGGGYVKVWDLAALGKILVKDLAAFVLTNYSEQYNSW